MKITLGNTGSAAGADPASRRIEEREERHGRIGAANRRVGEMNRSSGQVAEAELSPGGKNELRNRLMLLQREVALAQRRLAGLEGMSALLDRSGSGQASAARVLDEYLARVMYRGEAVLATLRPQLQQILDSRDSEALQSLIEDGRDRLRVLAQELSRYETAHQNRRALAPGGDPLATLKGQIRDAAGGLLDLQPDRVLRLLG